MPDPQRKIIHIDADCFFAAIEMRDKPDLANIPIAVGGGGPRGVVATCNYEARRYGVRSAMSGGKARRLCPNLRFVAPRFEAYKQASTVMREIFKRYTPLVEPLSLDEAFLDVSNSKHCNGSATLIASQIRAEVQQALNITVSAGVAPNKFLAKIASDWQKPNGLTVITPKHVEAFVLNLPINKLFGVGKVTAAKLQDIGVHTCADLRVYSIFDLSERFGSFGERLYHLCRGIDNRQVKPRSRRKSLSVENTYIDDLPDISACLPKLADLIPEFERRLAKLDETYQPNKAVVKIKFNDFSQTTIERALEPDLSAQFKRLLLEGHARHQKPVRLLGIGVRFAPVKPGELSRQTHLFD